MVREDARMTDYETLITECITAMEKPLSPACKRLRQNATAKPIFPER